MTAESELDQILLIISILSNLAVEFIGSTAEPRKAGNSM
jgi:hypothetical protein